MQAVRSEADEQGRVEQSKLQLLLESGPAHQSDVITGDSDQEPSNTEPDVASDDSGRGGTSGSNILITIFFLSYIGVLAGSLGDTKDK